jgi:hypothetical protein
VAVDALGLALGTVGLAVGAGGRDADVEVLVNTNSLVDVDRADRGVNGDMRVKIDGNEVVVGRVTARSTLVKVAVDNVDRCKGGIGDLGSGTEWVHTGLLVLVVVASDIVVGGVADDST